MTFTKQAAVGFSVDAKSQVRVGAFPLAEKSALRPVGFAETGPDSICSEAGDTSGTRSRGNPHSSGP
jgi:hypothetical protein